MAIFSTNTPLKGFSVLSLGVLALTFLITMSSIAQTSTEFWFAPPEVTQGHAGSSPIFIRLAAGANPATVTIDLPANPGALNGGSPITVNLPANGAQTVDLSAFVNDLETRPTPYRIVNGYTHFFHRRYYSHLRS